MRLTQRDEYGNAEIIALSDTMTELYAGLSFSETNALTNALNKLADYEDKEEQSPKSDVQEVKHGKWVKHHEHINLADGTVKEWDNYYCAECKTPQSYLSKYCPECGAKMDKGK